MLNKLNHIIPDLLLKPKFRFYIHLFVQIIIALITINNLFQGSDTIAYDRLWIWLLAYVMLSGIAYVNVYLARSSDVACRLYETLYLFVSCDHPFYGVVQPVFQSLFWLRFEVYFRIDFFRYLLYFEHLPSYGWSYCLVSI